MYVYVINQDEHGEEYLLLPLEDFETGNPFPKGTPVRMKSGTGRRLRGVAGAERANRPTAGSGRGLHNLAESVSRQGGESQAIRIQMFELANPVPGDVP